ncbi:ADP-ribosylglycohydrolase family protein [Kiritimatiellota bacterium B12222]|nr:ADP-ribosylglycohydrolase family protein [Kiritimatiellota bacterium B12222]
MPAFVLPSIPPASFLKQKEQKLTLIDRIFGGIFGLLLGDACGVPVEFSPRAERLHDPVTDMRGWGCHAQPPGHWSDDGALALAHIAAFIDTQGWQPEYHIQEFSAWYEKGKHCAGRGVFDIGESTSRAILRHLSGNPWYACGCRGLFDNGNGSLMRILPVGLWLWQSDIETRAQVLSEASTLTHGHRRSELACIWYGEICAAMLAGKDLQRAHHIAFQNTRRLHIEKEWQHLIPISSGACYKKSRNEITSNGYVISCLEAALWCLEQHHTFRDTILEAVNLGGDTDTTAAVCGGLAGLRYGYSGLPKEWLACLPRQSYVHDLALDFADQITRSPLLFS